MIDETLQDLAALHALDLLTGRERENFVRKLETDPDPELRRLVDEFREAAALSALAAPPRAASPALRARVLSEVAKRAERARRKPAVHESLPPRDDSPVLLRFPAWLGWTSLAAAAALAFVAADLWRAQGRQAARAALAETELRLAEAELRAARNQLEAEHLLAAAQTKEWRLADTETARLRGELEETRGAALARIAELESRNRLAELRIASLAALAGQPPAAQGVAIWDPVAQQGVLSVAGLPALAADRDYQLWVIDPQYPRPVDGGVFTVDPATGEARVVFQADKPVREAAQFAISLERKGGVPVAEGPMVLAGK